MYPAFRLAQWLSPRLPLPWAFGAAERLAEAYGRRSTRDREAVRANLSLLLDAPTEQGGVLIREVFRNFGRYLVEFFTMHRHAGPDVTVEGQEHLAAARQHGRGAILLTAHLGNWEVGAALIRRMGFPVTVVALPHADPRTNALFDAQRERCGLGVIPLGPEAARRCLQSLREGSLLGVLGDREFADGGFRLPFGRGAAVVPRGPAMLSLRSETPVVPTFLIREGRWAFRLCVEPPIWPDTREASDDAVRALTERYVMVLERYLRRFPDQWLMFQPLAV